MSTTVAVRPVVLALAAIAPAWSALGQSESDADVVPEVRTANLSELQLSLTGTAEHQFVSSIDGGGHLTATHYELSIGAKKKLSQTLDFAARFRYSIDDYSIDEPSSFGPVAPWEDIHTMALSATLSLVLDDSWTVFGGPFIESSRESGAEWGHSLSGGGTIGATYRASDTLVFGGGLGIISVIEDGVRVFPIFALHWQITSDLYATSEIQTTGGSRSGAELVYLLGGGWETAIGGAYRYRRFRLDGGSPASDGVGEDTAIPFWVRLTYRSANFTVTGTAGFAFLGDLELDDSEGHNIKTESYGEAFTLGIRASIEF